MKGFIVSFGRSIIDAYAFGGVLIGSLFAGRGLIALILSLLFGGEKRAESAFNFLIIGLLILVFIVLSTLFVYLLFDIRDHLADIKYKLEKYEKEKMEVQP